MVHEQELRPGDEEIVVGGQQAALRRFLAR